MSAPELAERCTRHFIIRGMPEEDAKIASDILIHANLRGVDSHGVARMTYYDMIIAEGTINMTPDIKIRSTGLVSATVDGDDGLGLVVAYRATEAAIEIAKRSGVAVVAVNGSSHCGALSYYVKMAARNGLIGIASTQADSGVMAFGGKKPFFGTNPLAYGFPAKKHPPVILDMATSAVAMGKIVHDYANRGEPIPHGWAVDDEGNSVTDPLQAKWGVHFGGAKGFGLALVADVFSGLLTSGSFASHVKRYIGNDSGKSNIGQFLCLIDPAYFTDTDRFLEQMDMMIDEIHAIPPAEGFQRVMVPGEPERLKEERRRKEGIPLPLNIFRLFFDE
ncbi:Ldh family oxidoreductase [Cohnella nanjingensis]|uniref:Ldh family oxidoreductase n=1 Tax=Cohnella nanjingensis TaxID=1387779 RepID=UPI001C8702A5|nr:Ldh family oxidoreductase [Cohnella nanjingensis]